MTKEKYRVGSVTRIYNLGDALQKAGLFLGNPWIKDENCPMGSPENFRSQIVYVVPIKGAKTTQEAIQHLWDLGLKPATPELLLAIEVERVISLPKKIAALGRMYNGMAACDSYIATRNAVLFRYVYLSRKNDKWGNWNFLAVEREEDDTMEIVSESCSINLNRGGQKPKKVLAFLMRMYDRFILRVK